MHDSWRCILDRAGIEDLHIHDLGHSFTSGGLLVCEGAAIGKLLGHNKVQTTARYAPSPTNPLKAAADSIASRIAEVVGQIDADAEAPSTGIW